MSSERRHTRCCSASNTSPSATGSRSDASTARFAPCTASGGCAAIVGRERGDLGVEVGFVDEPVAQPDAVRLLGVDARRGPDQLLRLARADDARQALRAAEVGQDAVLVLEQADLRAAREHADVARERELQPGAERVAVHRGDRRIARARRATRTPPACAGCRRRSGSACRVPASSPSSIESPDPDGEHRRVDPRRERAAVARHDTARSSGSSRSSRPSVRISCHIAIVNELRRSGRFEPQPPDRRRRARIRWSRTQSSGHRSQKTTGRSGTLARRARRPRPTRTTSTGSCNPATLIIPAGSTGVPGGAYSASSGVRQHLAALARRRRAAPRGSRSGRCSRRPRPGSPRRRPCPRAARAGARTRCVSCSSLHTAADELAGSTDTSMHPSPSHFAMRTPNSVATWRTALRNKREHAHRLFVAVLVAERRESGEVDEREPPIDSHVTIVASRSRPGSERSPRPPRPRRRGRRAAVSPLDFSGLKPWSPVSTHENVTGPFTFLAWRFSSAGVPNASRGPAHEQHRHRQPREVLDPQASPACPGGCSG